MSTLSNAIAMQTANQNTAHAHASPTLAQMAEYQATLEAWKTKLADQAVNVAIGYPDALKACNTSDDALSLLNGVLLRIVAHAKDTAATAAANGGKAAPSFAVDSFEYKRAIDSIYYNVKMTLKNYAFAWLPEGLTIGKKQGVFILNKVQPRKAVETPTEAELLAPEPKLSDMPSASQSEDLILAKAQISSQSAKLVELESALAAWVENAGEQKARADKWETRANSAETALEIAKAQNMALLEELEAFKSIIAAGKAQGKEKKTAKV